jgi:MoxR-like ATPase
MPTTPITIPSPESATPESLQQFRDRANILVAELSKVVLGQPLVNRSVVRTIFCGGHGLITGVPGLAKTLLIRSLAQAISVPFSRIQFTPDLMPSDITGTDIIEEDEVTRKRQLVFLPGPIFANLILADEINRTPPKTQAAMLQVMQEQEVTIGSKTYALPKPFHVFATQNPLEMEGTYILPEAQADRFMFCIQCDYPGEKEEAEMVRLTTSGHLPEATPVISSQEIIEGQKLVQAMPISDEVIAFAVKLVSMSRPQHPSAPAYVKELVTWGASPRASQYLVLGAKAEAALGGRVCADYDGVRAVAREVLGHRILPNFKARAQKVSAMDLVDRLLKEIPNGA